jgi:hypothetical protein
LNNVIPIEEKINRVIKKIYRTKFLTIRSTEEKGSQYDDSGGQSRAGGL